MRVLVVDDDPGSRTIVRKVAEKVLNVQTDEASNGQECLELLVKRPYALVVLDLQMPIVGGLETLQVIRATPALAHVPVVVLTGGADEEHVRTALTFGVSAYVTKPVNPSHLGARLVGVAESLLPPGYDYHRPGDTVAVVCGDDPDLRQRIVPMLAAQYAVREADDGDELLRILGRPHEAWTLRVVLCSVDPAVTAHDRLVEQVRALPNGEDILLFTAVPREDVSAARHTILWEGVLSSAMPPGMFVSQFTRLYASALEARHRTDDSGTLAIG